MKFPVFPRAPSIAHALTSVKSAMKATGVSFPLLPPRDTRTNTSGPGNSVPSPSITTVIQATVVSRAPKDMNSSKV